MSTTNRVQRKIEDPFATALNLEVEELIETGGIAFPGGHCIELIRNDVGFVTFLDSKRKEFQDRIKIAGQQYVPPILAPSALEALTLPSKRTDCGSTVEMFGQICNFFTVHGVSENTAKACTYFAFASWFPESLPVAPCLIITGGESEGHILLQLLTCVARHALPVAEFNMVLFDCIPMHIQPTMLIGNVHPSIWRVFFASNHPHEYLPNKKGLTDLYCAKAAYAGPTLGEVGDDAILTVHCTPNGGRLPVINGAKLEEIAADLQPRLLDYRLKYVAQVRQADFDAPTLPTPLRMMARALGACIVDMPELQVEIVRLLESQAELLRASRMLDPNCVAIEALLTLCHGENGPIRVGVNEIAATATAILTDRGETAAFESKRMGGQLRQLGFCPKRDSQGFAIHLMADVRRLTHRLARDHQVGDSELAVPGCPYCANVTSAQTGRSNS